MFAKSWALCNTLPPCSALSCPEGLTVVFMESRLTEQIADSHLYIWLVVQCTVYRIVVHRFYWCHILHSSRQDLGVRCLGSLSCVLPYSQGCGSAFIFCGSGSSISSQCGSGSSWNKFVKNYLPYEEFSGVKRRQKWPKSIKTLELVQIYCKNVIKCQLSSISLHFSVFSLNVSLLDPDPHSGGKMNADPDRIHSPYSLFSAHTICRSEVNSGHV